GCGAAAGPTVAARRHVVQPRCAGDRGPTDEARPCPPNRPAPRPNHPHPPGAHRMTPRRPTGTVHTGTNGEQDLVLTRTFPGSVEEVWASITEPDRLARWYGSYVGETGPGRTVEVTMTAEEGAPTDPVLILE